MTLTDLEKRDPIIAEEDNEETATGFLSKRFETTTEKINAEDMKHGKELTSQQLRTANLLNSFSRTDGEFKVTSPPRTQISPNRRRSEMLSRGSASPKLFLLGQSAPDWQD